MVKVPPPKKNIFSNGSEVKIFEEPERTYPDDLREFSRFIAALAKNLPERNRLLEVLGINPKSISQRIVNQVAKEYLRLAEQREAAEKYGGLLDKNWNDVRNDSPSHLGANMGHLSSVESVEVEWLWPQRIPLGKLTLISGDPDLGKTWIMLDIMSRITGGLDFPDSPNPFKEPRNVLWVSAEDDIGDTVKPRMNMLGGDHSRFQYLKYMRIGKDLESLDFSNKVHMKYLSDYLYQNPLISMIAVDPLAAFMGKVDTHKNSEVRRVLSPLSDLLNLHKVALVASNHLNKGKDTSALYRASGSIAFIAVARSAWMVTKDKEDPFRRLLTKGKNNLASEDVGGLAFRIGKEYNGISWEEGVIETTADQAVNDTVSTHVPAKVHAKIWLKDFLKDKGWILASEIKLKSKLYGIGDNALKDAKKELGVFAKRVGGAHGHSYWSLTGKEPLPSLT